MAAGRRSFATMVFGIVSAAAHPAYSADDYVVAGKLALRATTARSLTFEWTITGDANRNAAVAVSYRKKGEANWLAGPAMVRLSNEPASEFRQKESPGSSGKIGRFFGGIPNLETDTEYECRFLMYDPDGAFGDVSAATDAKTAKTFPEKTFQEKSF